MSDIDLKKEKMLMKNNNKLSYSALTLLRENSRFEITRLEDNKVAFSNRLPRNDSRVWSNDFLVWDLENNCKASPSTH